MHEKIKELALEAGGSHYPSVGGETLEKFAMLLIQDCIDQISMRWKDDNRIKTEIERREANNCIKDIKSHFGIK